MRNLVALQRRAWALEADAASGDDCVAFASRSGESQTFFLRASGRVELLERPADTALPTEAASDAPPEALVLFVDLREFVDVSQSSASASESPWKWMQYVAELDALMCASTSGALVKVDADTCDGEEIGDVDDGLRAFAWSDNQEMLALVTGAGALLVMNTEWEVLHETQIDAYLPAGLELHKCHQDSDDWVCELTWRQDSQFIALNVGTIASAKKEPGGIAVVQKVLVFTAQLDFHALGRLEDGRGIPALGRALHWSQSMALMASSETRKERLYVVFFERNGLRHGEFALPVELRASEYRIASVRWNTVSDVLAVKIHPMSATAETKNPRGSVLQLWTRSNYHWYLKQELCFETDNQLVNFAWDEESAGRLYLLTQSIDTQELSFHEREFVWDMCSVEGERPRPRPQLRRSSRRSIGATDQRTITPHLQSVAIAGVIDGTKLLLTPLHRAMVPPPFALLQVTFSAAVNSVIFASESETLLVLLSTGDVVLVENYLSPPDPQATAAGLPLPPVQNHNFNQQEAKMSVTTVFSPRDELLSGSKQCTFTSLLWMHYSIESRRLVFAGKDARDDRLVLSSVQCDASVTAETKTSGLSVHPAKLYHVRRACEVLRSSQIKGDTPAPERPASMLLAVQTMTGVVHTLNLSLVNPLDAAPSCARVAGIFPSFSHLTAVACEGDDTQRESLDSTVVVIGLEGSSSRLFVNGGLLASACSSFRYCALSSVLLYTTQGREAQLRMTPLAALRCHTRDQLSSVSVPHEARMIERGALLVATIGDRANVIVQMPRGNLECVAPRLLVLALVVQQVRSREYVAALEMCRRHRLDLNLLVDFDPRAFFENFKQFLVEAFLETKPAAVTSDRLCLFITNLHPVDVWDTKYSPVLAPFTSPTVPGGPIEEVHPDQSKVYDSSEKVNAVCRAVMQAIRELETGDEDAAGAVRSSMAGALLLPFVTCAVKQNPPRFEDALGKVQSLLCQRQDEDKFERSAVEAQRVAATRAIKHLIMLTDVERLYSEALGLYDLELVRVVASHSQRDPKEYVPFLDRVAALENESWRKYTIDMHLGRHERALVHLSALMCEVAVHDETEKTRLQTLALELVQQGELYDQALKLFPLAETARAKQKASESDRVFHRQLLLLKGGNLETSKCFEAAAYVYLSASEEEKARRAFLAASNWQMALALSASKQHTRAELQNEAYAIAQELLNAQTKKRDESVKDVLAAARIYVEYCDDVDEAVGLLVAHQQWSEALRVSYLHQRRDLVESDVETGVLQAYDDVLEELKRNETQYTKHWKRLSTIREQKRLFKLHGIDGSRWGHGQNDGETSDVDSVRSGASSAADSALSNVSASSVGSHNSAASIGNFSMQSLAAATSSHFYATQALGDASGKKVKAKKKHGGILPRRERRKRMKEGSAEEEAYVAQQLSELRPSDALKHEVAGLLKMLIYFGHVQQAQKLQSQLGGFEDRIAANNPPAVVSSSSSLVAGGIDAPASGVGESSTSPQWRLEGLLG